jgi:hypothetical protein
MRMILTTGSETFISPISWPLTGFPLKMAIAALLKGRRTRRSNGEERVLNDNQCISMPNLWNTT